MSIYIVRYIDLSRTMSTKLAPKACKFVTAKRLHINQIGWLHLVVVILEICIIVRIVLQLWQLACQKFQIITQFSADKSQNYCKIAAVTMIYIYMYKKIHTARLNRFRCTLRLIKNK